MQDGAPGHAAAETQEDLHERGIYPIFWPAFSPDLNPIEKATALTEDEWSSSVCSAAPVAASHSLTILSPDAEASCLPSGEKAPPRLLIGCTARIALHSE
jgi:transposase